MPVYKEGDSKELSGVDYDVAGVGWWTHLIISAKLPTISYINDQDPYQRSARLASIVKDIKGVTAKDLAADVGIPFHPAR